MFAHHIVHPPSMKIYYGSTELMDSKLCSAASKFASWTASLTLWCLGVRWDRMGQVCLYIAIDLNNCSFFKNKKQKIWYLVAVLAVPNELRFTYRHVLKYKIIQHVHNLWCRSDSLFWRYTFQLVSLHSKMV